MFPSSSPPFLEHIKRNANVTDVFRPLTGIHKTCILIHMKTTLNIDESTLKRASALTGVKEKTLLVKMGLEALISRESGKRLAELGGMEKGLRRIPRRKIKAE
jgi:hypothetical protein